MSADTKKQLERYGFAGYQQRPPGLLIPLQRADGSVWGYQLRADKPRETKAGNTVKYETPAGQRNGIDVPPGIRDSLADPSVPLLVTEGTRKADSAVSHGLACVALPGCVGLARHQRIRREGSPSRTGMMSRSTAAGWCSHSTPT